MTIREYLTSMTSYSVSDDYINVIGEEIGVANMDANVSTLTDVQLNRSKARVYLYLVTNPNISEGGMSISFTATERKMFWDLAKKFAFLAGETGLIPGANFGYKGENL